MIRGQRVILDSDLAAFYGVSTLRFNEAVKRNVKRFPSEFRFQITREELANLISQNAISSSTHGGRRKLPWAFTEHGALMVSSVLHSDSAIRMSIAIIEAFVQLREFASAHREIAAKFSEIERKLETQDGEISNLFEAIRQLLVPVPEEVKPKIGFHPGNR